MDQFIHTKRNTPFSLIELLVVVTILSILASLLLPALQKAKDQAYATVCANNQKQISLLFTSFSDDNNQYLPKAIFNSNVASPYQDDLFPPESAVSGQWYGFASGYNNNKFYPAYRDAGYLLCPAHPRVKSLENNLGTAWSEKSTYKIPTNHFSIWYYNSGNNSWYAKKRKITQVSTPAVTLMMMEEAEDVTSRNNFGPIGYANSHAKFGHHHNGNSGFNASFFDGHVDYFRLNHDVDYYTDYQSGYFTTGELGEDNFN